MVLDIGSIIPFLLRDFSFLLSAPCICHKKLLGAKDSLINKIFILEGWMISLAGLAGGLLIGISFALLQQHFGFIKMPGHFVVQAYPVILSWSDVLLTTAGVATVGYVIATLPVLSNRQSRSK